MMKTLAATSLLLSLVGCGPGFGKCRTGCAPDLDACSSDEPATALAIGDSIMRFNARKCGSIPDVVGGHLGVKVENASSSGAKVSPDGLWIWGDIREQYKTGDWDWVLIEGGINDLNQDCACGECSALLDQLATPDGRDGDIPALVDRALDDGANVVLVGYYPLPETATLGLGRCDAAGDALDQRLAVIAESRPDVIFVDPGDVVSFGQSPQAYRDDHVHPTLWGSATVGAYVADAMRRAWSP